MSRWWEGAVLYQVYIRSWQDTDGDGFGDLPGVVSRLDHLSMLGIDGLWLSPVMPSPDEDWGYDVSDYLGVHPQLGSLDDLERLVSEADARGIRVLLDLVPNHTSNRHPWFLDALQGRGAPHRDWYVWVDPSPSGGPPNNWLDSTGASAWTLDEASGQYYLHNFLPSQPNLNWWNPAVREEFERVLRFWFDRGIGGFRIDVAHGLFHDRELRDDPPAFDGGPASRFGLAPVHSMNQPEVHGVYRDWRAIAESYDLPRLLLGETWVFDFDRLAAYYGKDDELQLAFNFPFVFSPFRSADLAAVVDATWESLPAGACPVWVASNHDVSRFPTRWCDAEPARVRAALVLLCTLPGTVVLYYGDELGLGDVAVPVATKRDAMTRGADGFNRDRARTPMPWEPGGHAGFCPDDVDPWLPIGDRRGASVAEEHDDPGSDLALTRRLLALRRRTLAGGVSPYAPLGTGGDVWAHRSGPLAVAVNLGESPASVALPDGPILLSSRSDQGGRREPDGRVRLDAWEAVVVEAASPGTGE